MNICSVYRENLNLSSSPVIYYFVSAALSVFIAGSWLGWPSPALRKMMDGDAQIKVSPNEVSWIVALMDFGNIISPIPSSYLADFLGRKTTLVLTAFLFFGTWVLTILAETANCLFAARIGAGIGKGVVFTVVPMYLGEIASVQVRGALSTIFTALLYGGTLFEYCIGPFVSYTTLNIISGSVPIVFFLSFICLPDSPYFHLMKERHNQAKKTLAWFRNAKETNESLMKELDDMSKTVQREMKEKGSFKDLLKTEGNQKALTIVLFLSAFQRFGGVSCLLAYTVITLPKTGGYLTADIYMVLFGVTLLLGNFISTPLMDRLGRKPLLIVSCLSCAISTGVSAVFYWVAGQTNDTDYNWVPYVCFVLYGIAYGTGIGVIPTTFVGELFPTNIKSLASAIAAIFFAIASFAINKVYLFVKENYGVHFMFVFFTLSSLSSVIFTMCMVFETKGKTFTEIQNKLNKIGSL